MDAECEITIGISYKARRAIDFLVDLDVGYDNASEAINMALQYFAEHQAKEFNLKLPT